MSTSKDVARLRELAKRVRDEARSERMEALRGKWRRHNDLETDEPMVLIETGPLAELIAPERELRCEADWARQAEKSLLLSLYQAETVRDDTVLDDEIRVNWRLTQTGWRDGIHMNRATDARGGSLAHIPEPVLKEPYDVSALPRTRFSVDREATMQKLAFWEGVYGDILRVRLHGSFRWSCGMTADFLTLTGMEPFLTLPYDDPDAFHAIMRFLQEDLLAEYDFLERENLLSLNNGNDYVGSGTYGFTGALPGEGYEGQVRRANLWVLMESQESVNMSPAMFREFIFPYQKELAEQFGLCYYGCCEPVHNRFDSIEQIANLRSVSVSPWCDMAAIAERARGKYVFSRKPNPAWISTERFEEELLREDMRAALKLVRGTPSEFIMKDVHTVSGDAGRLAQWVSLAREEIARA